MSDAAVDTSSAITTKDLKEKKEVVEEAENGRDAPAHGNANEENGEQEADSAADEEVEEGGEEEEEDGEEDEEADAATGKRAAEDGEDDSVDTKKQKTDEDD
ncbi:prothymosin alpha-like [Carlito syrichta]|uniref:Prothymosin alpha n=1 Tax=Carlito syrichta TaxID=1868482 RepID=A0A1U7SF34_CARSF|nr:prothymosin alpha-like [Carlito syrichta]